MSVVPMRSATEVNYEAGAAKVAAATQEPAEAGRENPDLGHVLDVAIAAACKRIPPLWPLRHFVAVNPYLGFTGQPFHQAAGEIDRIFHAPSLLPLETYRDRYRSGRILDADIRTALREAARQLESPDLLADDGMPLLRELIEGRGDEVDDRIPTWAEAVDAVTRGRPGYEALVRDELSKWCAARFDSGQAAWTQPWRSLPLYAAWREEASIDLSPELGGLSGFRRFVRSLPADARETIAIVLDSFGIPPRGVEAFLARSLGAISGWAGHVAYIVREAAMKGEVDDSLVQLLAVRLAYDGGVRHALGKDWTWDDLDAHTPRHDPAIIARPRSDAELRMIWQLANEAAYRRDLTGKLGTSPASVASADRPQLQAVFCIDVRSEILPSTSRIPILPHPDDRLRRLLRLPDRIRAVARRSRRGPLPGASFSQVSYPRVEPGRQIRRGTLRARRRATPGFQSNPTVHRQRIPLRRDRRQPVRPPLGDGQPRTDPPLAGQPALPIEGAQGARAVHRTRAPGFRTQRIRSRRPRRARRGRSAQHGTGAEFRRDRAALRTR